MSSGFLDDFNDSMSNLNSVKDRIQRGVQMREEFTTNLKSKLSEIKSKLVQLIDLISNLKQTADDLQSKVNNNNSSIGEKERQIEALTQQVAQSQQERDEAIRKANEEKQSLQSQIEANQQKINTCEENLRIITDQKNALEAELQQKGVEADAAIKKLGDDNLTLLNQIADRQKKIESLEQQIIDKDKEIDRIKQEHDSAQGTANSNSQTLQTKIDELTTENKNLIERIVAATNAINSAVDALNTISASAENATTQGEVTELLQQIEETIENIARAIQGQRAAAPPGPSTTSSSQSRQTRLPPDTSITVQGTTMTLNQWIIEIKKKIQQVQSNDPRYAAKYQDALNRIINSSDSQDVANIINGISKNGSIYGGRRTKKNRKQKGGFTYKPTSTRRSISSNPTRSKRISRRTSRRVGKSSR